MNGNLKALLEICLGYQSVKRVPGSSLEAILNNEEHCHVAYDSRQLQFIGSFVGGFAFAEF